MKVNCVRKSQLHLMLLPFPALGLKKSVRSRWGWADVGDCLRHMCVTDELDPALFMSPLLNPRNPVPEHSTNMLPWQEKSLNQEETLNRIGLIRVASGRNHFAAGAGVR